MASSEGLSVEQALSQPVEEMLPGEAPGASSSPVNGHAAATTPTLQEDASNGAEASTLSRQSLMDELARAREERDGLESQYKGLLGKLTQMRSTLGDRLRQDAVSWSDGSQGGQREMHVA